MGDWPFYAGRDLLLGSPDSQVGIITLWTRKEEVAEHLSKKDYCVIGQLYNNHNGISLVIRNCLANKNLRYLVLTGEDLSGSGSALKSFFEKGVDKDYNIIGEKNAGVHKEIPIKSINVFRKKVRLLDYRGLKDFSKLKKIILEFPKIPSYGRAEFFPEPIISVPSRFPSDGSVFVVRQASIGDAWLRALHNVVRFGSLKKTEFSDEQLEVVNLVIVTGEDPDNIDFKPYFLFSREELSDYFPKILTANSFEGVEYTYGQRLRNYQSIDQISNIVSKLGKNPHTRRALAVTWNVVKDLNSDKAPCINLVQAVVQDDRLFFTAYIRSNDIFKAWPLNAYGLRKLQKVICDKTGFGMGTLTTVSCSAHVYKSDIEQAVKIINSNGYVFDTTHDPYGSFTISINDDLIEVLHLNPDGKPINKYSGKSAVVLCERLARDMVSDNAYHLLYLGKELARAEHCLKNGKKFFQS